MTTAVSLDINSNISFIGTIKRGSFDLSESEAKILLGEAGNPNGRPNSDVILPYTNAVDLTVRDRHRWIIDFGVDVSQTVAAGYSSPFRHVRDHVRAARERANEPRERERWWLHARTRPEMRDAVAKLERFLVTPGVSKHRIFVWLHGPSNPDHEVIVLARSEDAFLGILHSRLHETWARAQGTQLRERESGFRYTPPACFETFPLPRPTKEQESEIGAAAKELNELRERWLDPPEWTKEEILEFPGSVGGPWARYVVNPDSKGIGTVRYPRIVAKDAECAAKLKKRTLTNLYNERPAWLDLAHKRLDEAVAAAYVWKADMPAEEILEKLLALNLERAAKQ